MSISEFRPKRIKKSTRAKRNPKRAQSENRVAVELWWAEAVRRKNPAFGAKFERTFGKNSKTYYAGAALYESYTKHTGHSMDYASFLIHMNDVCKPKDRLMRNNSIPLDGHMFTYSRTYYSF